MRPISHRDLAGACLWAGVNILSVLFVGEPLIRLAISAPLVLFLTGHAALRAIGPVGASLPERIVYAVGASIAVCLAGGFLLNAVGWLRPLGWAVWLAAATCLAGWIAVRRKQAAEPSPVSTARPLARFRPWQVAAIAVAALVSYGAYALAARDEARQHQFTYTEFWIVPVAPAGSDRVVIGIKSGEQTAQKFDVEIRVDGATVALLRSIDVAPGATWTRQMLVAPTGAPATAARPHKAEALLYKPDGNILYRRVSTIIPAG